jgi:hypothetical protein
MKYFLLFLGYLLLTIPGRSQGDCRSFEYRQDLLKNDVRLSSTVAAIEQFTRQQLQGSAVVVTGPDHKRGDLPPITIPVVVHILYNTSAQNITDAQVQSQIDVLNADYRKQNADTIRIPGYFNPLAADCGFQFVLAGLDSNGAPTTGIVRKHTAASSFSVNDNIKFTARGGDDAWDRDRYLNIWVGNLGDGNLGYSSVVGCMKETDGIVVQYTAFGTRGTAAAPFNLGKTATHEIGHWLNLIHIWGDAACGDDAVADTPPQGAATRGNPSGMIMSCGNGPYGNMYMNYMDFTDDIGMHMFTNGQRDRMRTLFNGGGFRYPLLSSPAASVSPITTGTLPDPVSGTGKLFNLQLYPNPTTSMVSVRMNDATLLGSVLEVYNQIGEKVMTLRIVQLSFQLNISSLPGGIYFVRLRDSHQQNSFKLVKI